MEPTLSEKMGMERVSYNSLLEKWSKYDTVVGITRNKMAFLRRVTDDVSYFDDNVGSEELALNLFMSILCETLDCNVKLFTQGFVDDMRNAVKEVMKRHNIKINIIEDYFSQ